jgi:hypothetical protein
MEFTPEHPEAWRVSFKSSPARGGSVARRSRVTKGARFVGLARFQSAWPLAERYEALIRVVNNPAPYARRLAQRLYRAPKTARLVLKHHPSAAALVGVIEFDTLCCAADEARNHAFPDTS